MAPTATSSLLFGPVITPNTGKVHYTYTHMYWIVYKSVSNEMKLILLIMSFSHAS